MFEQNLIRLGLVLSCANRLKFSSSRWSLWEGWFVISKSWPFGRFGSLPGLFDPSLWGFRRLIKMEIFQTISLTSLNHYSYLFRFGCWARVWSGLPTNLVGNCSFSYLSLSCCFLASSNERLPLNDGANPLNTLDGGRNGSFNGRFGFFFNGDLSKMFLKGFFMLILIGFLLGGFDLWSFLSGRWWSRLFSLLGKNSSTLSWLTKFLSLWLGLRLGGPRGGGSPFLFGLINVLMTSPSGLKTSNGWHLSGRLYYF